MPPSPFPPKPPTTAPWQSRVTMPGGNNPNFPDNRNDGDSRINEPWTDSRLKSWVDQTYPNLSQYLIVPEIRQLMLTAGQQGWTDDKINHYLSTTTYVQNLTKNQPAPSGSGHHSGGGGGMTAQQKADQLASVMSMLNDKARTYGLSLTNDQLKWIAQTGINASFIEGQYNDSLLDLAKLGGGTDANVRPEGQLIIDRNNMQAMAKNYLTELSPQTLDSYAMAIERGEMNIDGVRSILMAQSKARHPYLASMIDQGITPMDYFAPTRDVIARTLEMPSESVDLMDPKWINLVEVHDDKAPNGTRAATLSEAMQAARKRPEWAKTENAQDLAATWSTSLVQAFGGKL